MSAILDWMYNLDWRRIILWLLIIGFIGMGMWVIWYMLIDSRESTAVAETFKWEYVIGINSEVTKHDSGDCDDAPIGATIDSKTKIVVATPSANSSEEVKYTCTWHTTELEETRSVSKSGVGKTGLVWPVVDLRPGEEKCDSCWRKNYSIVFKEDDGALATYNAYSESQWFELVQGQAYRVSINRSHGVTSVGAPVGKGVR